MTESIQCFTSTDITSDSTLVGAIIDTLGSTQTIFTTTRESIEDGVCVFSITEGDLSDGSDAVVADVSLIEGGQYPTFDAVQTDTIYNIQYLGSKRYLSLNIQSFNVIFGCTVSAVCNLEKE